MITLRSSASAAAPRWKHSARSKVLNSSLDFLSVIPAISTLKSFEILTRSSKKELFSLWPLCLRASVVKLHSPPFKQNKLQSSAQTLNLSPQSPKLPTMKPFNLTPQDIETYNRDGYVTIRGFCTPEETDRLYSTATGEKAMLGNALDLNDQEGKKTRLSLWFTPPPNVFGYLTRSRKVVSSVDKLMEGTGGVCHFHSKLMQKEPRVGGAWEWHQDYGYWYKNQFMFADQLISVMIALTAANKENGCLQVIKGSHKLGRVNHGFAGEQVGADMVMVNNALKTLPLEYCIIEAGDAVFFHPNLLHRSEANLSDRPRWSIISCYCAKSNLAYNETSKAWTVPLEEVPDEAILNWKNESFETDFLKKENDPALKQTGWEGEVATEAKK
jgi:ectoine hydroxylase-related dioxygenase (phytanoyl-CoA dioxygenase family)